VTEPKLGLRFVELRIGDTQLAQTTLRSIIGKMELDKTFEERDLINAQVVAALDDAARAGGVKVCLRDQGLELPRGDSAFDAGADPGRARKARRDRTRRTAPGAINVAIGAREPRSRKSEAEETGDTTTRRQAQARCHAERTPKRSARSGCNPVARRPCRRGISRCRGITHAFGLLAGHNNT